MRELTPAQQGVRRRLLDLSAQICELKTQMRTECRHKCVVLEQDPSLDSAYCAICERDMGWYCPNSENHFCEYRNSEYCCGCGQPSERK